MGLLPLEFTDCLQDSPYFRDSLHSHEKELERTSSNIKELIKEVKNLLSAAKNLSRAQRSLSSHLLNFKFDCIGSNQTDDELVIAGSLKEFGKLISSVEDERDRMLEQAIDNFVAPLETFRKEQIGAVKARKKQFDYQTKKFCASQERYLGLSTKKQDNVLQEADAILEMEQRDFAREALEYVCLIQEVQERKKFEFVETLQAFMYGWLTFYHQGHEVAKDFKPFMTDLQIRVQKTRTNFQSSRNDIEALMRKMLEVRQTKPLDPGTLNKMYTRTGYLFCMEKKALGTTWIKCYCQYIRENRLFCMIPYNQTTGKITNTESFKIKSCLRKTTESIDKRFCFDLIPEDRPNVVFTLQAQSEDDLALWLEALDGKQPRPLVLGKPSTAEESYLDEAGFNFMRECFKTLENRGLEEEGLYRVVGVASKVTKLLNSGLDRRKFEKLNIESIESKTITSAIKTFCRNLPEPLMSFSLHQKFIEAAKYDTYSSRLGEVHRLVHLLPAVHLQMLELLLHHLSNIVAKSDKNLMTVSNLGVCFGPTLLRAEEETVAAIMDIKFANVVVEILIQNWQLILKTRPGSTAPPKPAHSFSPPTPTSPPFTQSSPVVRPPPYIPPPSPLSPAQPTLTTAVIFEGPKIHSQSNGPSYATWERTLKSNQLQQAGGGAGGHQAAPHRSPGSVSSVSTSSSVSPQGTTLQAQHNSSSSQLSGSHQQLSGSHQQLSGSHQQLSGSHQQLSQTASSPQQQNQTAVSPQQLNQAAVSPQQLNQAAVSPQQLNQAAFSPNQPPWYRPNQIPVRAIHLQQQKSAGQLPSADPRQLSSADLRQLQSADARALTRQLSGASAVTSVSTTAGSSAAGHLSGYDTSTTHRSSSSSTDSLASVSSREGTADRIAVPGRGVAGLQAVDLRRVRTLYACVGEHDTELSFEPNQIITSVRPSLEPGWLEGNLDGKVGLVPENYVEYVP